jgi:hypothetical protein
VKESLQKDAILGKLQTLSKVFIEVASSFHAGSFVRDESFLSPLGLLLWVQVRRDDFVANEVN